MQESAFNRFPDDSVTGVYKRTLRTTGENAWSPRAVLEL